MSTIAHTASIACSRSASAPLQPQPRSAASSVAAAGADMTAAGAGVRAPDAVLVCPNAAFPPCDKASRLALESDLPEAFAITEPAATIGAAAADAVCTGRASSRAGVGAAGAVAVTAGLAAGRAGWDGFAPSAARPFWDSAWRLSSAAARAERGFAVLFPIASLMLLSFRVQPDPCEGHLLDSLFNVKLAKRDLVPYSRRIERLCRQSRRGHPLRALPP